MMSNPHHCKISVVDASGTVAVSCVAKVDWGNRSWSQFWLDLEKKVLEASKGVCDLPAVPFRLYFIGKCPLVIPMNVYVTESLIMQQIRKETQWP